MKSAFEIQENSSGASLSVRVKPRASRDRVLGVRAGRLEISVTAPPEDGKANEAVCRILAQELGVARSRVRVKSGGAGRLKRIVVEGLAAGDLARRLGLG